MVVRYAIMGMLDGRELHGYAIKSLFEARLAPVWALNFGQVYQILKDLKRRGFVTARYDAGDRHMGRWMYTLSDRGRRALDTWLRRSPKPAQPLRDELFIRLLVLENKPVASALDQLARGAAAYREQLVGLESAQSAAGERVQLLRSLAEDAVIAHVRAHLEWLVSCSRVLTERQHATSSGGESAPPDLAMA